MKLKLQTFFKILCISMLLILVSQSYIYSEIAIPNSEILTIQSNETGELYELLISLPGSYSSSNSKYPVIYVLDAQWDFGLVDEIKGDLNADLVLPEIIVVGITYHGKNPDYGTLRTKDLSPTPQSWAEGSGRAPKFLNFLKKELIPYIENKYRVNDDRTLFGVSLGGLFTIYSILKDPELFKRRIAISPFLEWDNSVIFKLEEEFAKNNKKIKNNLYIAAGDEEHFNNILPLSEKFYKVLINRKYEGLNVAFETIKGGRHSTTKLEALPRGLRYVTPKETIKLDKNVLKEYPGVYEFDIWGYKVNFIAKIEKDNLVISNNEVKFILSPISKDHFVGMNRAADVAISRDGNSNITGISLRLTSYQEHSGKKIK